MIKVMGVGVGGGGGEVQKNIYHARENLSEKNSFMQSRPEKKWPSTHFAQISRRYAGKHTVCKTSAL